MPDAAPTPPSSRRVNNAAAAPATRENGYVVPEQASSRNWWTFDDQREETPELRWPDSVLVYDRMRRQDAKVKASLKAVKSPLLSTTWRLDPGPADPAVTEFVSRELGLPIKGVSDSEQPVSVRPLARFSWRRHLEAALRCLDFGSSVFEQVYTYDEAQNLYHLRKLGPRPPWTIERFNVARDGGLISVEQKTAGSGITSSRVTMPVNRLVVYTHEMEDAEWWGQSVLRSAYKHWLLKDRLLRVDTLSIDRNGMGIPVHTAAEGGTEDDIAAGLEIARDIRSGDNSGASLPYGATLQLMGVTGDLPDPMKSVHYHDDQIGGAVLAHFLNLGRQTGSWALGSTFADFFISSLNGIGSALADTTTQHVVYDLVDLNFGEDVPAPIVVYDDLAGQDQALAYAIKALVDAGVIVPDDALQTYLRTAYKLPQPETTGDDA